MDSLSPDERTATEAWSRALDVDSGFERLMGWLVEKSFRLPVNGDVGDVRAYSLPERIGVMTLRSLSPHGEEDGGRLDDGL
jgi:hypothetical protein